MFDTPASELVRRRLSVAARRLGTRDPNEVLGPFLDRSFPLPVGDVRYGGNALTPGAIPIEHSFSEISPQTLRFAMEPLGPETTPLARRNEVNREMRSLVSHNFGGEALRWFDARSESWRGSQIAGNARFGAWFGAGFDEMGLQEAKAYYELGSGELEGLPPNLRHACRVAMACLPALRPIFSSVACTRNQGSQRVYFYHAADLRLMDLEPLMNRLGIGHQLPGLLTAVGLILGGRFVLPEGSVVLSLRDTTRGIEMKVELLLPAIPDPPAEMHGLIQMLLSERPESQRALRSWLGAMTTDQGDVGKMSVVSVRVGKSQAGRLSLYFRPSGYDRAPGRDRPGSRPVQVDPYAVRL